MKKLYIIRHAKSSWGDFTLPDFERPLNERGKTDAPIMAKRLLAKKIKIDAFVSSPAKRAKKTCKLFCNEYGVKEDKIIFIEKLYLAHAAMFFEVVKEFDNKYDHVAIFAHNPGITDFANRLCKDVHIDEMPTCSVFAVNANIENWNMFKEGEYEFLFFDYPKQVLR
ncbi:MAG: histidine phosphatase family protein [Ferruginibacter sp.]